MANELGGVLEPGRDQMLMQQALQLAYQAADSGEVPVGCVILCGDRIVAAAHNQREQLNDPTAHAEMIAITQAAEAISSWRLEGCTLYVTLEPCPMCAGAILQARIPRVVFGAFDPKAGVAGSLMNLLQDARFNHRCEVTGNVLSDRCGNVLSEFFARKRTANRR